VVNKWAGLYGYDDAPEVVFGTTPIDCEERHLGAWFSQSEIYVDTQEIGLECLGHEFAHWLQYKQGRELDEDEAEEIGMKLAKNEIISRANQLPLV